MTKNYVKKINLNVVARNTHMKNALDALFNAENFEDYKKAIDFIKNNRNLAKAVFSEDSLEHLGEKKLIKNGTTNNPTEIFFNFFGMNKNWDIGRNILGALMVHCPEWPTYFIPAYTQAKATGDAHELKKGEGPRGILTGALEGLAVGALVSGRKLKFREMVPYIILGSALQLFSSKIFPWMGEKLGQYSYNKQHPKPTDTKFGSRLFVKDKDNPHAHPKPDPAPLPKKQPVQKSQQQSTIINTPASGNNQIYTNPYSNLSRMKV